MLTYQSSGVSIEAGDETVSRIKPLIRSTYTPGVIADVGLFGGLFDGRFPGFESPVLVASADGVGTKLKIAFMTGIHNTIGHDLVNHCTNDILACGAEPLFFLDYFATGKLAPTVAEQVVVGLAAGCRENGCALIGGETAEMPGIYTEGEYDLAGTIIGVVEKSKILLPENVRVGDILVGLPSSGLHTNGYSLARAALFPKFSTDYRLENSGKSLGEALLAVHRSYLRQIRPLLRDNLISAISHITGGGIIGNTKRILPVNTNLDIFWDAWEIPEIFNFIQFAGSISDKDMREAFNLGVGVILAVKEQNVNEILSRLSEEKPFVVGRITS